MESQQADDVREVLASALASRAYSHDQDVDSSIAAVVTVEGDLRFLPSTLSALFAQSVLPGVVVIADCSGSDAQPVETSFEVIPAIAGPMSSMPVCKTVTVRLVRVQGARSFGAAVCKGLRCADLPASIRGLWLLHDDSRPADRRCLEHLLEAWRNAPTAAMVGAKQLDWDCQGLHDVGAYVSGHRVESLVVDGEPDQEQYDARSDVFAVSLAGALVPSDTLTTSSGLDGWFSSFVESSDFCRRICRGGGRVIVAPRARIAHRRARFEGIRGRDGEQIDDEQPADPSMSLFAAWQRYYFTDVPMGLWPLAWLWRLVRSLGIAIAQLLGKRPWQAWCELCMPWLALLGFPRAIPARRRVARCGAMPRAQLAMLSVSRDQMRQWKDRERALQDQRDTTLLSPLVRAHLRWRLTRRWILAALMTLVTLGAVIAMQWPLLRDGIASGSLSSSILPPTDASLGRLAQAASTPWLFGVGTGVPAPPAPWLMVLLVVSVLTGGHVSAALLVILVLALPLSALSFWALAGVFTRSDAVRVVGGLLWASLSLSLGLLQNANLPMLTVMVFLPASFAFVFRAVGMYYTEDPLHPHPSVQAAAAASLCFMPVVAAEPQTLLPLIAIFLVFILVVRGHRAMLLLIPLPAAFLVAPTLVNAVRYFGQGSWRQLFGDVTVPDRAMNGKPAALSLGDVMLRAFGFDARQGWSQLSGNWMAFLCLGICAALLILAVICLALPFALRVSRMMWIVSICGALLSLGSCRVTIALDEEGAVAGSVLPGLALLMLGMLSCACLMAGGAVRRFVALAPDAGQRDHGAHALPGSSAKTASRWVVRFGRGVLIALLAAAAIAFGVYGASYGANARVSDESLPMIASDALEENPGRRVLALEQTSPTAVEYSVMRSSCGDLIDSSPAYRARQASGMADETSSAQLADIAARLLSDSDAEAIDELTDLGFSGVWVRASDEEGGQLEANITSSEGVQPIVTNDWGVYYRLDNADGTVPAIDESAQDAAVRSPWRLAWLSCAGVIVVLYCLVAIPHRRRTDQEG